VIHIAGAGAEHGVQVPDRNENNKTIMITWMIITKHDSNMDDHDKTIIVMWMMIT